MTNKFPVADLHCDLLCYLQGDPRRSPFDAAVRCSLLQMQQGGVSLQVLPIFTITEPGSTHKGEGQVKAYSQLHQNTNIRFLLSIENASGFFEEDEPFSVGLKRLEKLTEAYRVVYISPTWNSENRFGGGTWSQVGLKEDGKALLHFLHGRRIAYDCSHNSDNLMKEALDYIDAHHLDIPILASHSNMRAVADVPRNLPDPLVKEILRRGGIIGLNFYRPFIGNSLTKHLEHLLGLGAESQVCFGADFFHDDDLPVELRKKPEEMFFAHMSDSSAFQSVLQNWKKELGLSEKQLQDIASGNLERFLEKNFKGPCLIPFTVPKHV